MMDGGPRHIRYPVDTPPEPGDVLEIAEGILWARLPLPMALNHVNVYILDDGDGWTVVDTGVSTRKTRDFWQSLLDGPLAGRPVRRVLVTHHHPDHVGLAGWFQTEFGAELLMTRTAWLMARMLSLDVQDRPTGETVAFWASAGMDAERLQARMTERPFNFADILWPLPLGYTRIADGDAISIGGRKWTVRTGGGHAPEHATLWSEDADLALTGDQVIASISPNLGVYATEPEADPVSDWLESCARLSQSATPEQLALPGHKLPFFGIPSRFDQLVENHIGALGRLTDFLAEPRTAVECFDTLYKRQIGEGEYGLALVESMSHCLHLWHKGRVTRTMRKDGAWLWQAKERHDG